jgi:hypothetical protein
MTYLLAATGMVLPVEARRKEARRHAEVNRLIP